MEGAGVSAKLGAGRVVLLETGGALVFGFSWPVACSDGGAAGVPTDGATPALPANNCSDPALARISFTCSGLVRKGE